MRQNNLIAMSIRGLLTMVVCGLMFAACSEPIETNKGETALEVVLSADTVTCNQSMGDQVALQLSWTSGTNHQTGSALSYAIDIDTEAGGFTAGIHRNIGKTDSRVMVFTHRGLSDSLKLWFAGIEEEAYTTLLIRVSATVLMTGEVQESPVARLVVAPYKTRITELYMVGDATPNGWDNQLATPLLTTSDPAVLSWTGVLHKGEMKFLVQPGAWLPCYVKDEDDATKMVYRGNEDDYPDYKWDIDKASNYTVRVNTDSLTVAFIDLGGEIDEPRITHIYMIGDATPGGWSWDGVTEMTQDADNKYLFTYDGTLLTGEIKFPTQIRHDWGGEMIFAPTPNCAPTENGTYDIHSGEPDNKWVIPTAGNWHIAIDTEMETISFIMD